ncbi:unnamed protein product [Psylliodes chrysocephalus]|uniref:Uncharacterized protein n=1 Tax=Psylliodes chrysocephalus TaxID=3402493 RepID=A0A9P0G723_9CUCU|nr:unnamed protein product [Psylliodes chrysocephala]
MDTTIKNNPQQEGNTLGDATPEQEKPDLNNTETGLQNTPENITENQGTHNINTPILSISASDDKSDDYVDADDNTNTMTTNNKPNPIEGENNPAPPGIQSQEAPIPPPNNSQRPTPQMQAFQSAYVAESKHPTKMTIKRMEMPTEDSDSEFDDEIGKIVKRKRKNTPKDTPNMAKTVEKPTTSDPAVNKNKNKPPSKTAPAATNNKKALMPPIVVDGKTVNQTALFQDLRAKIKGGFSVKHTNSSTILFVDDKDDHQRVLKSVKEENIAHHTYTTSEDKSHAFVLRGLAEGTQTQHIEDDLVAEYDIKVRNIFRMNTKNRPFYL